MRNCDACREERRCTKEAVPNETASKSKSISELFRGRSRGVAGALLCFLAALVAFLALVALLAGVRSLSGIGRSLAAGAAGRLRERQAASEQQRECEGS